MSVKIRPFRGKEGVWEVDIMVRLADGQVVRERRKAPVTSKSAALRWGQERERSMLLSRRPERPAVVHNPPVAPAPQPNNKEVPTIAEFAPRFVAGHYKAERRSPATIATVEVNLRQHIVPVLGDRRLDQIGPLDVTLLKEHMRDRAVSTVNVVLNTLRVMVKKAMEWEVTFLPPATDHRLSRQAMAMSGEPSSLKSPMSVLGSPGGGNPSTPSC